MPLTIPVDQSAWAVSAPTPTSTGGAFTTVSVSLRVKTVGKTAFFVATVTVTAAGTATGNINVPLPFTPIANFAGGGKEISATGLQVNWQTVGASLAIARYDNTTIIGSGNTVIVTGTVETT